MLLKQKSSQILLEVLTLDQLFDPFQTEFKGILYAGEELQDPEQFKKSECVFPSDEPLPACWSDHEYRHHMVEYKARKAAMAGA